MNYSDGQLRGLVLEEVILFLLSRSGYEPVCKKNEADGIFCSSAGMQIQGRGTKHQIDAIADYRLTPPFSNPLRLMVEAKHYDDKIRLPVVRNSLGVLRDVSENWIVKSKVSGIPRRPRWHYISAIFSASDFTRPAQDFAYAQDIYLLPLRNSAFFRPVIEQVDRLNAEDLKEEYSLTEIRQYLREQLLGLQIALPGAAEPVPAHIEGFDGLLASVNHIGYAVIAMLGRRFPTFLVAAPGLDFRQLGTTVQARIRWRNREWYIDDQQDNRLFSFDLPRELFELYAEGEGLDKKSVAQIKGQELSEFYAYYWDDDGTVKVVEFRLDRRWYAVVQQRLRNNVESQEID
ncbi:MAG: hypothetical protein QGM50_10230 [Anaerolineae bacterium]|nr:hypothetical protein [Anaerolineae bacterium]